MRDATGLISGGALPMECPAKALRRSLAAAFVLALVALPADGRTHQRPFVGLGPLPRAAKRRKARGSDAPGRLLQRSVAIP